MLDLGQYQIRGTTAREIAHTAESAIREGLLDAGDTLPTVRALAQALGTSPATVSAAYRMLRERGFVLAEGRRGTRVAPRPALRVPVATRVTDTDRALPPGVRDLSIGLPDPALLPPTAPALARIDLDAISQISGLERADPELLALAAAAFEANGLPSDALAVVAGAFDGIERVLQAHLRPGDRVIIEDPAYIGILDLLRALGLVAVAVPVDELGFLPEPFEAALRRGAEAALIVPRAQNPYGSALDDARSAAKRPRRPRR
jgi:DNA-binding transcriptional MocR family regulator